MIRGQGGREIYENVLLRLKEITGATIMGFHLAYDASTFGQGYTSIAGEFREDIKSWRKDGFSGMGKCPKVMMIISLSKSIVLRDLMLMCLLP